MVKSGKPWSLTVLLWLDQETFYPTITWSWTFGCCFVDLNVPKNLMMFKSAIANWPTTKADNRTFTFLLHRHVLDNPTRVTTLYGFRHLGVFQHTVPPTRSRVTSLWQIFVPKTQTSSRMDASVCHTASCWPWTGKDESVLSMSLFSRCMEYMERSGSFSTTFTHLYDEAQQRITDSTPVLLQKKYKW